MSSPAPPHPSPSPRPLAALSRLFLLALLIAPSSGAAAQEASFEGAADVVHVEVPVNVVGRDGQPVRGLTAADFVLLDDGKRQQITHFEVVDRDTSRAPAGPAVAMTGVPSQPRHLLLLFDLSFSTPTSVARAREAALGFVQSSLHPDDLVAVALYTLESGPRLLVSFTPDRAQLARAIDTLGIAQLLRRGMAQDPLRLVLEPPGTEPSTAEPQPGGGSERAQEVLAMAGEHFERLAERAEGAQKSYERAQVRSWAGNLSQMARALAAVEGRKHVIYFSEGFDGQLLLGRQPLHDDPEMQRDQLHVERGEIWRVDSDDTYGNAALLGHVDAMLEEFRRADCVIQAVDIRGLRAHTSAVARGSSVNLDALFYVASQTGGELLRDANDLGAQLDRALRLSEVTYVLGYTPHDLEPDGRYHRLTVRLAERQRARLSHRTGYYAPRGYTELHPLEKSLLASDAIARAEPRREVRLDVLAAPFKAGDSLAYVPVIVEVDGTSLLAGHVDGRLEAELYAYAVAADGTIRDLFAQTVVVELDQAREALGAGGLKYYGHLMVPPGDHTVRVLVRNGSTGRTGVAVVPLAVPPFGSGELAVLPPFFPADGASWLLVREPSAGGDDSVVYPFTVDGEPYIPAVRPRLAAGEPAEVYLIAYNLGAGAPELGVSLRRVDGEAVGAATAPTVAARTVTGIENLDKLRVSFDTAGLTPGDYVLELSLADPVSGARRSASAPLTVR